MRTPVFAAPQGSAGAGAYFRNEQASNVAGWLAYQAHEGANFTSLGLMTDDDYGGTASYGGAYASFYHHFFDDYIMQAVGMAAVMDGESESGLPSNADNTMAVQNAMYNNYCGFFGDGYNVGVQTNDAGNFPISYGTTSDLGFDLNLGTFAYSGNTVTTSGRFQAPYGSGTVFNFVPGDKFRPLNFTANGDGPFPPAPAPLVDGTDYYIVGSPTSSTFQLSATPGGTPITFAATVLIERRDYYPGQPQLPVNRKLLVKCRCARQLFDAGDRLRWYRGGARDERIRNRLQRRQQPRNPRPAGDMRHRGHVVHGNHVLASPGSEVRFANSSRHCERSEAIPCGKNLVSRRDCFVAYRLLAMTDLLNNYAYLWLGTQVLRI